MKYLAKLFLISFIILLSCEKQNASMDAGGPIVRYLRGKWKLDKIVTPSSTKLGPQIGYKETIESGNDQVEDYEKLFRNDSLVATYTWSRSPAPIANASDMTAIISYRNNLKRYYKIINTPSGMSLQASGYISEIGSIQDSVKYYYSEY